jgi:hypothetical protein
MEKFSVTSCLVIVLMTAACGPAGVVLLGDAGQDPHAQDPAAEQPETMPDLPGCTNPMPDDCLELSTRLWPTAADAGDTCRDSRGNLHPSTGEDSAEWFNYSDCGSWKEFSTAPCTWVLIHARGDTCDGCVLWHISYVIEENIGDAWSPVLAVDPEPDFRGMTDDQCYQTPTGRFRIQAVGGFYVQVFVE